MAIQTRTTDAKGRVTLPKGFAQTTVLVEQISANEVRVCKAKVIAVKEAGFAEEKRPALSNRDRDLFLALLANPPAPNAALRRAARKYQQRHRRMAH